MALISEQIISQIIDRCDIVETIASYIPLKKAGRSFKANCPFHHEKTPSFVVNPDKQIFHCFGCGVGGNVISFVMKQDRLEFPEAVKALAQKVNIELPEDNDHSSGPSKNFRDAILKVNDLAAQYFHGILLSDKTPAAQHARGYLQKRGVSLQAVKDFHLGFALDEWDGLYNYLKKKDIPLSLIEKSGLVIARDRGQGFYDRYRNRIIFPIFDHRGQCRAFGGRILEKPNSPDEKSAKYINSPETDVYTKGHYLYGLSLAKQSIIENDTAIIVEGYMDCLMPYQHGVKHIVASLGTALTVDQIRLLRRFSSNVIFLFDMDPAGQAAMMRSLDILVEEGLTVKVATLTEGTDPDSFIRDNGVEAFKERLTQARDLFDYKLTSLRREFKDTTIEGKAKISREMLSTIGKYENSVVRSEYLKKLAKALSVDVQALTMEIKKTAPQNGQGLRMKQREPLKEEAVIDQATVRIEYGLLKTLLEDETLVVPTQQEVSCEHFKDTKIREVITKIYELFNDGKKITVSNLMMNFDDPQIHEMLSRLSSEEFSYQADSKKIHQDLIERMKGRQLKLTRRQLLEQIRAAEEGGDTFKLDQLKNEFNTLVKG